MGFKGGIMSHRVYSKFRWIYHESRVRSICGRLNIYCVYVFYCNPRV